MGPENLPVTTLACAAVRRRAGACANAKGPRKRGAPSDAVAVLVLFQQRARDGDQERAEGAARHAATATVTRRPGTVP